MYINQRCLIFDESGNLGTTGRYFVISCIDTMECKSLHNIMKRKVKKAGLLFPDMYAGHSHEIKAKDAYPMVKYHILESIASKNLKLSYIVLDLKHIEPRLLKDKNILYNYATKILVSRLCGKKDFGTHINFIFDNKTTKITSRNSLNDYIALYLNYECMLNIDLNMLQMDSDDSNAYVVQAADYVANAIYGYYEYGNSDYYNILQDIIDIKVLFPHSLFGK